MITQAALLAKKKKKLYDFLLLFPGSKPIMLRFQASSSQNSCVTERPNAKPKKKKKKKKGKEKKGGGGRVWPKTVKTSYL